MVKIKKGDIEINGDFQEVMAELSSAFAIVADNSDRKQVIAAFLASFYSLQSERNGNGLLKALEMFKEDTKEALNYIEMYSKLRGKNIDEKLANLKGENNE